MSAKVSVVIPYYQEEPGILRQAVASAIAQDGMTDLEIIVVDDGSPAPARDDLKGLELPAHVTLKLIEQPNRGPGAARNHALDHVGRDTNYVAFLDSDDRWTENHLRNALSVLETGYDFYFSDFLFSAYGESAIARSGLEMDRQICLDHENKLYRYVDDAKHDLIGPKNCIHTPTVVYRYGKFDDLRFPEELLLGEDRMFFLQLARRSESIAFGSQVECFSGEGIHLCQNSSWGKPRAIWGLYHDLHWRKALKEKIVLSQEEDEQNSRCIRQIRKRFVLSLLHEAARLRVWRNKDVAYFFRYDPTVVLYLIPVAFLVAFRRIGFRLRPRQPRSDL